jgi:putative ABC transport system ATP-binding protein
MNIIGCLDRPSSGRYRLDAIDVTSAATTRARSCVTGSSASCSRGSTCCAHDRPRERRAAPRVSRHRAARAQRARPSRPWRPWGSSGPPAPHAQPALGWAAAARGHRARHRHQAPALARRRAHRQPRHPHEPRGAGAAAELNAAGITIVLVTHEHDIAACAKRVITMRDGRVRTDVRTPRPTDAAATLAELAPAELPTAPAH